MQDNKNQVKMTAGNQSEAKMVKIRTMRPINMPNEQLDAKGQRLIVDNIIPEGQEIEVTEAQAKEFCDQQYPAGYDFEGELTSKSAERHKKMIVRAVRV